LINSLYRCFLRKNKLKLCQVYFQIVKNDVLNWKKSVNNFFLSLMNIIKTIFVENRRIKQILTFYYVCVNIFQEKCYKCFASRNSKFIECCSDSWEDTMISVRMGPYCIFSLQEMGRGFNYCLFCARGSSQKFYFKFTIKLVEGLVKFHE
jgi:hypothetical protein